MSFVANAIKRTVDDLWSKSVIEALKNYILIPNQSPLFDPEWETNKLMDQAAALMINWVQAQKIPELEVQLVKVPQRTPVIFIECQATVPNASTVLMYGHLDKQPPFSGWNEGLGPYLPVLKDGKLYGRGSADDGYALFSAITAIMALKAQGLGHGRIVIIIESSEESGSRDLPFYIEHLRSKLGTPNLIICLDSGCGNFDQMWITTSLRGGCVGDLSVTITTEGIHSGDSSGIVPDTFRIARHILSRIEDPVSGEVLVPELKCEIPPKHIELTKKVTNELKDTVYNCFPFITGASPTDKDLLVLALNRTWKSTLTVTGAGGLPDLSSAGNVLRPNTTLKLSIRLPPIVDNLTASEAIKRELERDPPYGAKVFFNVEKSGSGWIAPEMAEWLENSVAKASETFYGKETMYCGEGGSIPFMGMLGKLFPQAQFLITGVLGPQTNAHGPNEFLHVPYTQKLTCCVAAVLFDHGKN